MDEPRYKRICTECNRALFSKTSWSRHVQLGCERHNIDGRRGSRRDDGDDEPVDEPMELLVDALAQPRVQQPAGAGDMAGPDSGAASPLPPPSSPGPAFEQQEAGLEVMPPAEELEEDQAVHGEEDHDIASEELDLESPLVESLLEHFPDLGHDLVNEAVDDLLQTLEELQAQAGGSDGEDDELLEELIGLDLRDNEEHRAADPEDVPNGNKPLTGEWYYERRNEMLFSGSTVTVLEQCFVLLGQKVKFNLKDNYLDQLCRWNAETLGEGNLHPPSLHILRKVMQCPEAEEYEQHVCPNECMCFSKLKRAQYKEHQDECCLVCGAARFQVKQLTGGRRIIPTKVFWYLGMKDIIRDQLFADPKWCDLRASARDAPHDYYTSSEAERLNKIVGGLLFSLDNSGYELGFDYGQCFAFRQYSVGVLGFRCADVPHSHRAKRQYCHVLAIIPGPKEPANLAPYLKPLLLDLHEAGPDGPGVLVTETKSDGASRSFHHRVFITGVYGDTPALKKLQGWLAHNARLGCGWCWLRSVRDGNAQYWYGYENAVDAGRLTEQPTTALCGDGSTRLTSRQQEQRALEVVDGNVQATEVGCHGISPLVGTALLKHNNPVGLPYVSYNDLWIVPVAHASLLGLVKDFWKALLGPVKKGQPRPWYVLPAASKDEMVRRGKAVSSTDDFGRPYRCVVSARGSWVMEDWLHWTETFSCLVLGPSGIMHVLHDERLRTMWGLLRNFILHHMRMGDASLDEEGFKAARHAARNSLEEYAKLAEGHFGKVLCKYNLHMLVCRLWQQQRKRGHTAFYSEFWVELLVQLVKSSTKYRSTTQPELVIVNHLLLERTLAVLKREHGLRYFEEYISSGEMRGVNLDDGILCQLLGSGKVLRPAQLADAEEVLVRHLKDFKPDGWVKVASIGLEVDAELPGGWARELVSEGVDFLQYTYAAQHVGADLGGQELVLKSLAYLRSVKRVSYFVQVRYEERGAERTYVARIKHFLRCTCTSDAAFADEGAPEVLRIAVCDLFAAKKVQFEYGSFLRVKDLARPAHVNYPVSLTLGHVDRKLVYMSITVGNSQEGWFVGYDNASASL